MEVRVVDVMDLGLTEVGSGQVSSVRVASHFCFSSIRRHTRYWRDWSSDVCSSDLETSNRIADVVMAAFSGATNLPTQGQGTMNNTIIGGPGWTYYETVGGGQGASSKGSGPSGVHVGMSNTLNTPVEAFEMEYPMRVERYELLYDSGGDGEHRGGDGIVRAVRVLEPASLSLLTDRRRHPPQGIEGDRKSVV